MLRKRVIPFILLAVYSVVLAHSVIPHHHHSETTITCQRDQHVDNNNHHHQSCDEHSSEENTLCDHSEVNHENCKSQDNHSAACNFNIDLVLRADVSYNLELLCFSNTLFDFDIKDEVSNQIFYEYSSPLKPLLYNGVISVRGPPLSS